MSSALGSKRRPCRSASRQRARPRACEVALAAVLQALLQPAGEDAALLTLLADAPLVNWNGIEVGRLQAAPALHPSALRASA